MSAGASGDRGHALPGEAEGIARSEATPLRESWGESQARAVALVGACGVIGAYGRAGQLDAISGVDEAIEDGLADRRVACFRDARIEDMAACATLVYRSRSGSTASYRSTLDELEGGGRTLDLPQEPVRIKALPARGIFHDLYVEAPDRSVCVAQWIQYGPQTSERRDNAPSLLHCKYIDINVLWVFVLVAQVDRAAAS